VVFDVPKELGPLRWSAGWRERSDLGDHLFATVMTTLMLGGGAAYGLSRLLGEGSPSALYVLPFAIVAIVSWVFFGPDRHCYCAGERGASISRQRFGFLTSRDVLLYEEADDIELESTRVVSDAVGQIYTRTELKFTFIDREGYEVFAIAGEIDEPDQRATPKYDPTAPLQLDGPRDRGAEFGFAAMDAFHAFKDQRPIGPYR
jgi:hypothetical protein